MYQYVRVNPPPSLHHSGDRVCAQLPDHVPNQLHPWSAGVGPGADVPVPRPLRLLHPSDLQAASDQQEGLLHGGWQLNVEFSLRPDALERHRCAFPPVTGSSPAFSAHSQRICQHLPDVSAEWGHMDPFLRVDGCR